MLEHKQLPYLLLHSISYHDIKQAMQMQYKAILTPGSAQET